MWYIYICGIYIYVVYIYVLYVHDLGMHGRFFGLDLKRKWCLRKQAMAVARSVNDDENDCRFEVQKEEYWIHTRPTWSIAVRETLQELF